MAETDKNKRNLVYFGETIDSEGYIIETFKHFANISNLTEWYSYFYTTAECAEDFDMTPGLVVFKKFDQSPIQY